MVTTAAKLEPKTRLSAADWEQAALDTIAESGLGAVAVESLARRLGVTKGSFYWHFPTREALIKAALERWERRDEDEVMAPIEPIADPRARLRELFKRVSREMQSHVIYAALMQSLDHPLVKPVMAVVAIFTFQGAWEDFMGPLLYLQSEDKYTLQLGLRQFEAAAGGLPAWNELMAASFVGIAPALIVIFFLQRYLVGGLTAGAVKQ